MKNQILCCMLFLFFVTDIYAQTDFQLSQGVYRIPYANGTSVQVTRNHLTHTPAGRIDMRGTSGGPYTLVAAGHGTVRFVVDNYNTNCNSCSCNNYIWIEHANGEWTKYSHIETNSALVDIGDLVFSGSSLGIESDVGCASGDHCHFEVGVPDDPANPINVSSGGHIIGENRIPVICEIPNNFYGAGTTYTAENCTSDCFGSVNWSNRNVLEDDIEITFSEGTITTSNSVDFQNGSNGLFQATSIILSPGFEAHRGSQFISRIGDCYIGN